MCHNNAINLFCLYIYIYNVDEFHGLTYVYNLDDNSMMFWWINYYYIAGKNVIDPDDWVADIFFIIY